MQNNQAIPFNKENFKQICSKEFALVIISSIPGALLADYLNIPLAWFLGPMLVTSVISLFGFKVKMPRLILSIVGNKFIKYVICGMPSNKIFHRNVFEIF